MASTRQILQRRNAVGSIARVTRTLEMISTARYKKYSGKRPAIVDFHDALTSAAVLLSTAPKPIDHPLLRENRAGRRAIVAIGSRKGLCGSYNVQVSRLVRIHVQQAESRGEPLDVYTPECRLEGLLRYQGVPIQEVCADLDELPTSEQTTRLADHFVSQYRAGELDQLGIVYMRYFSTSSQKAQTMTILPFGDLVDDLVTRAKVVWPWALALEDFEVSPPVDEMIEELVRKLMHHSILNCFLEAALSEHLARMVAMRNATESADEMIKELTGEYNRARQAQITGELLDIVSGSEAMA